MVWQAYRKVKANKGGSGIDQMTWDELDKNRVALLYKLWNRMSSGSYFPQPVKEVSIKKKDGGERKLGIPTLLDRIAQEVVRSYLEPKVEPRFHRSSYGYRPNRDCHQAVEQSCKNCFGNDFVIDLDIKAFFDRIDHGLLERAIQHHCKEKWVLLYINRWLKAGIIQKDGMKVERMTGTPQGGVISPLIANIFMDICFDKWMGKYHPEKPFERYADDVVVHCKTEKQAKFVLNQISQRLTECKLELHPDKTKIINLRGKSEEKYAKKYDFLGFSIQPQWCKIKGKGMLLPSIRISAKSEQRILSGFRTMEIHKRRIPIEALAQKLKPVIRGIINYYGKFSKGHLRSLFHQLNVRLLKWVKWEKGLYKLKSLLWLRSKFKQNPELFPHWILVNP
jgi:group II intron reverse transcriptase/maturase